MHLRTEFWTKCPQKTFKRIIECFKQGKDPQGYPISGWKLYLDTLNFPYADHYKLTYGSLLVYAVDGEETRTCLVLHAHGKDVEEKDANNEKVEQKESNPFENERYISATSHFWTPYEQEQHPNISERQTLMERFDKLMELQFASLFDDVRKKQE